MKIMLLYFFLSSTLLFADAPPLSTAPLLPIEPQFPLGLTQANRDQLIDNPEEIENSNEAIKKALEDHSFPWLTLLVLLAAGGIGWAAYLAKDNWIRKAPTFVSPAGIQQSLLERLDHLEFHENMSQIYFSELSSILSDALQNRLGWKKRSLTTEELKRSLSAQSVLSLDITKLITGYLNEMDTMKFAGKKATFKQAEEMQKQVRDLVEKI